MVSTNSQTRFDSFILHYDYECNIHRAVAFILFFSFVFFLYAENDQIRTFTKDIKRGLSYDSKASQDHNVLSIVRRSVGWFV